MGYANRKRNQTSQTVARSLADTGSVERTGQIAYPGFLNLIQGESVIFVAHPSGMNYIWVIIFGVMLIPVFLIGIAMLLYAVINIKTTTFVVTNKRIVVKTGFLRTSQSEIRIEDIRGVSLQRGLWQRIIGTGDISIGTAATGGAEIVMSGISKPNYAVQCINEVRKC